MLLLLRILRFFSKSKKRDLYVFLLCFIRTFLELWLNMRPAMLHGDMLPLVSHKLIVKTYRMTLSGYFIKVRFRQQGYRALTFALARLSCLICHITLHRTRTSNSYTHWYSSHECECSLNPSWRHSSHVQLISMSLLSTIHYGHCLIITSQTIDTVSRPTRADDAASPISHQ